MNMVTPPIDRLSSLLEQFRVRTQLSFSGQMCGLHRFDQSEGKSYLHLLRRGELKVSHAKQTGVPRRLRITEPTLLFYPRPFTHAFHNPPENGPDFTCAEITFSDASSHPIARALPAFIAVPLKQIEGLAPALELLFAETTRVRCGHRVLADRLFEVVLIQLLRWMLDHPHEAKVDAGLIVGLSSPQLAKALVAVHDAPEQDWPLERLAECAGMSRSAFAGKFRHMMGQTPADYVADWRLCIAQNRLQQGMPLKLLAGQLGYANQSALSRVFSARLGVSPREWLRRIDSPH
jgi:AraC-like DNA-binding protein